MPPYAEGVAVGVALRARPRASHVPPTPRGVAVGVYGRWGKAGLTPVGPTTEDAEGERRRRRPFCFRRRG